MDEKVKHCPEHQVLGGLSVCLKLQLSCHKAIASGLCPLGYKVAQPKDKE